MKGFSSHTRAIAFEFELRSVMVHGLCELPCHAIQVNGIAHRDWYHPEAGVQKRESDVIRRGAMLLSKFKDGNSVFEHFTVHILYSLLIECISALSVLAERRMRFATTFQPQHVSALEFALLAYSAPFELSTRQMIINN